MLSEIVALGNPEYLALDDFSTEGLRWVALGRESQHVCTAVFHKETTEVWALEIFDPEGIVWCWSRDTSIALEGQQLTSEQAMQSLAYLMGGFDDPTR